MKKNHQLLAVASMLMLLCCLLFPSSSTALLLLPLSTRQYYSASRSNCPQSKKVPTSLHATASSSSSSSINEQQDPRTLIQKGMQSFRNGDISTSLQYFNKANDSVPNNKLTPYLWQRGISYYYLDMFQEGHEQFSLDVKVNPLDVEEIVWDIACLARMNNSNNNNNKDGRAEEMGVFPVENQMSLPKGKQDRRKIMSTVYSLFRNDGATEYELRHAGHIDDNAATAAAAVGGGNSNISDEFYSLFYLGLYCEIRGEMSKAEMYMKMAQRSRYATGVGSGDYMSACARVHCQLRGWV
ncbi:hypothetical protein ACHAWT_004536 [Skeletonema menzelii]